MAECTCEHPVRAADPRITRCLRCCFPIPEQPRREIPRTPAKPGVSHNCKRCNGKLDFRGDFLSVSFRWEPPTRQESLYLCADCLVDFKAWMGIVPL